MCVGGGWGGENRGEGEGSLGSSCVPAPEFRFKEALYSARRKEQVLNTAVPGCRKHADPGLRTPGV